MPSVGRQYKIPLPTTIQCSCCVPFVGAAFLFGARLLLTPPFAIVKGVFYTVLLVLRTIKNKTIPAD